MNELERFEKQIYQQEKEEFLSDKCSTCMSYLDEETGKCKDRCCPIGVNNQ